MFAALKPLLTQILVSMNWGLIQQNLKKHVPTGREKIKKRCKEFMKERRIDNLSAFIEKGKQRLTG